MSQEEQEPFRAGMEPNFNLILQRILAILQGNARLSKMVKEWRVGDLPERTMATEFPAVYVAMSRRPQTARKMIGAAATPDTAPAQQITTEVYIACLATGPTAADAQLAVFNLSANVRAVLLTNNRLALEGSDPLCGALDVTEVPRMDRAIGRPLEGMTVVVRLHNYRYEPAATA